MDRSLELVSFVQDIKGTQTVSAPVIANEREVQRKFNSLARSLRNNLFELQNMLNEISPELNAQRNILQFPRQHEILKQDMVDHEIQKCTETCHMIVVEYLEALNSSQIKSSQIKQHFINTIYLMEQHLRRQIDSYTKMRSLRYAKLQSMKNSFRYSSHLDSVDSVDPVNKERDEYSIEIVQDESCRRRVIHSRNGTFSSSNAKNTSKPDTNNSEISVIDNNSESVKQEAILEQENLQLVHEMKTEFDEVKSIQSKLHEISQLQHIFAEEVIKQKEEVEIISDLTTESAIDITEGNKFMRKAVQRQFTPDGIVLFIIVIFTVALWFLDWYQD